MRPSPNSFIVKRPLLLAVTLNLGVIICDVAFYLQGVDVQIVVISAIAALALINALFWFVRKWAAPKPN